MKPADRMAEEDRARAGFTVNSRRVAHSSASTKLASYRVLDCLKMEQTEAILLGKTAFALYGLRVSTFGLQETDLRSDN